MTPATTRTASLLQLCLLGVTTAPVTAIAAPAPDLSSRYPRCQPVPPTTSVSVRHGTLSDLPVDVQVHGLATGAHGTVVATHSGTAWLLTPHTARWSQVPATKADVLAVNTDNQGGLWAAGSKGTLLRYYGHAWDVIEPPNKGALGPLGFSDSNRGVVLGEDGKWWFTKDAGKAWTPLPKAASKGTSVHFGHTQALRGAADGSVTAASMDPKGVWTNTSHVVSAGHTITSVLLQDANTWAAVDDDGHLFTTTDAGLTWRIGPKSTPPVRGVVRAAIGSAVVSADGRLSRLTIDAKGATLHNTYDGQGPSVALGGASRLPDPPAGIAVTHAAAGFQRVVAVTADGKLMTQMAHVVHTPGHPCGRPLQVSGKTRLPQVLLGDDMRQTIDEALSDEARTQIAAGWLTDARAEHASVASFARFMLRLMALGAPPELLRDAQIAMADEIEHADLCFALASRFAGRTLRAGPLPLHDALSGPSSLADVAAEVLREGAVGETLGAALAGEMLALASDDQVVDALSIIARDEAQHAQMAWRFLTWAVEKGGDAVKQRIVDESEIAIAETVARYDGVGQVPMPGLAAHGRLTAHEERDTVRRTLAGVVRPCVQALCG